MPMSAEMEDLLRSAKPEPRDEFVVGWNVGSWTPPERRRSVALARGQLSAWFSPSSSSPSAWLEHFPWVSEGTGTPQPRITAEPFMVERTTRLPEFVVGRGGELRLRYRQEVVRRPMTRCR